jgi:hypothetical protein
MKNTTKIILAVAILVVVMAGLFLLYQQFGPNAQQGEKHITISIIYDDGTRKDYEIDTDAEYLKEAVESVATIEGTTDSQYGYTLTTVDGVTADFSANAYWAIYVDGEYGSYGLDKQPVTDGSAYELLYSTY